MKKQLISFFFCLLIISPLLAQKQKFGFELKYYLTQATNHEQIPLLVEGNSTNLRFLVESLGGSIRLQMNQLYSLEIPADKVKEFSLSSLVYQIDFSLAKPHFLSDTMLINTRALAVQNGQAPLRSKYTGKGVVLGFIDAGIEINHPDFRDLDSNNRILYLWDQSANYQSNRQANQYTYGIEWDSTSIANKVCTFDDSLEYGHGSNVTAAAASSGMARGNYKGVAPEAKIISVATNFNAPNWLQTVVEAVDYIYKKADSLNLPCVINASVGTYLGSHDGEDIAARMIDQMIQQHNGRSMVCAAGNAAKIPFHLQFQLNNDTAFSWFKQYNKLFNQQSGIYFKLWSDTADFNQIEFSFGADQHQNGKYKLRGRTAFAKGKNRLNQIVTDSISNSLGKRLATVQTYVEQSQGRYLMQVFIHHIDSTQYNYRFECKGAGKIDIWTSHSLFGHSDVINSGLPTIAQYTPMKYYQKPDSNQTIVSSFSCLPSVITVGNYVNRTTYFDVDNQLINIGKTAGSVSENSSLGPNRNNYLKPDISSSGDYMFAAGRLATISYAIKNQPTKVSLDSMHFRNGGTSMASPTVAGMMALLLEQCPDYSAQQLKTALLSTARSDQFTNNLPNNHWGYGKADAFALLQKEIFSPKLSFQNPPYCNGDSLGITTQQPFAQYQWNNGNKMSTTYITQSDTIMAWVKNSKGCLSPTDTVIFKFFPKPQQPTVHVINDSLKITAKGTYQWYFNNKAISQATQKIYKAQQSGDYFCELTDSIGCSIHSDTVQLTITTLDEAKQSSKTVVIYPNPTYDNSFTVAVNWEEDFTIFIYSVEGQFIFKKELKAKSRKNKITLANNPSGLYIVKIQNNHQQVYKKVILK